MLRSAPIVRSFLGATLALTLVNPAWALFGDDEARKAIVELRQALSVQRQALSEQRQALSEQRQALDEQRQALDEQRQALDEQRRLNAEGATAIRRSILDISTQAEQWRQELGTLRGEQEQLQQENLRLQQALAELVARIQTFEPVSIEQDGNTLLVSPPEKAAFERAMALLLASKFSQASAAYVQLLNLYPNSAYTASVLYWLGNAQYASQDTKGAINTHKRMVVQFPRHARVPEAMLSMGNAHAELGDIKAARLEWDNLIASHPQSEAADTARERINTLPQQ
jgi:tol-pal system protein YbgF